MELAKPLANEQISLANKIYFQLPQWQLADNSLYALSLAVGAIYDVAQEARCAD